MSSKVFSVNHSVSKKPFTHSEYRVSMCATNVGNVGNAANGKRQSQHVPVPHIQVSGLTELLKSLED